MEASCALSTASSLLSAWKKRITFLAGRIFWNCDTYLLLTLVFALSTLSHSFRMFAACASVSVSHPALLVLGISFFERPCQQPMRNIFHFGGFPVLERIAKSLLQVGRESCET